MSSINIRFSKAIGGVTVDEGKTITLSFTSRGLTGAGGKDGREVTLEKSATHLQWGYVGETPCDLVALSDLKGDPFLYNDFTPEQIKELQAPAIRAASIANNAAKETLTVAKATCEVKNDAIEATENANEAAQKAIETAEHPTIVGEDNYVYQWNSVAKSYLKTEILVKGNTGLSAYAYAVKGGYQGTEEQFGTEQAAIAGNSTRLKKVEDTKQDKPIAGRTFLTPLFVARGAVFNDKTGYYELNGLTDITEDQMSKIYSYTNSLVLSDYVLRINTYIRTNYPMAGIYWQYSASNAFALSKLEVINLTKHDYCMNAIGMFSSASKLKKIIGIIRINYNKTIPINSIFNTTGLLEDVNVMGVQSNISFSDSPNLTHESILYLINNAANTTPITVTLHEAAKLRLTEEDIALASSKNITIA